MEKGICRLCQQEKELLNKSHIISEFFYKHLNFYDDNHKFKSFDIPTVESGSLAEAKGKIHQKGIWEGGILCENCDNNIIRSYEDVGKAVLIDGKFKREPLVRTPLLNIDIFYELDYARFKLFILSLLWRVSIATVKPFDKVKLTNEQEERLREMIYKGDPGEPTEFPFLFTELNFEILQAEDLIVQPHMRGKGDVYLSIPIGRWMINYKVEDNRHIELENAALNAKGEMPVTLFNNEQTTNVLKSFGIESVIPKEEK